VDRYEDRSGEVLIAVVSDGAGSASLADVASRLACKAFFDHAWKTASDGGPQILRARAFGVSCLNAVRAALEAEARDRDVPVRELACTLLAAVVFRSDAAFLQVGDGLVVHSDGIRYDLACEPQHGEYANVTNFVTDEAAAEQLQFRWMPGLVYAVALATDGIEGLALHRQTMKVHAPFFEPMFARLRREQPGHVVTLQGPLESFLASPSVNARTDDDKTLVLATRGEYELNRAAAPQ
jgi:hypothetical protein